MNLERLNELIKESHFTKTQIAEKSGISRTTLDNVLAGADAKISTVEMLAQVLGVNISYLFGEELLKGSFDETAKQAIYDLTLENTRLKNRIAELEGKKDAHTA